MTCFPALHELNLSFEIIDHLLIPGRIPPLGGEVEFAPSHDDPEMVTDSQVSAGRWSRFFFGRQVNVATELGQRNFNPKLLFEVLRKTVNKMVRALIALMNQRIVQIQELDAGLPFAQFCDVGVVEPERIGRRADVGFELTGASSVQVAHGGGHYDDIARTLMISENKTSDHDICVKVLPFAKDFVPGIDDANLTGRACRQADRCAGKMIPIGPVPAMDRMAAVGRCFKTETISRTIGSASNFTGKTGEQFPTFA